MSTGALSLVRRWAIDWLASHDPQACDDLLAKDYAAMVGPLVLDGRDAYVEAVMGQLRNYPGLGLTIHQAMSNGTHAAVHFTEHGAALHKNGAEASWTGIALFETANSQIVACWAEEDYASRSRQLASGTPDVVGAPATAPWDGVETAANPAAEALVREWLAAPSPANGIVRDGGTPDPVDLPYLGSVDVDALFSSGNTVAFHGRADVEGIPMGVSGLLMVQTSGELTGHVVTDRLGVMFARRKRVG
ncbi:hypothetical protein BH09ACT10_BH09ACT10_08450 [soil metagenome]